MFKHSLLWLTLGTLAVSVHAAVKVDEAVSKSPWDVARLSRAPQTYPAPGLESEGVQALFFEGLPWQGKPTRVFAYIGIPPRKDNEKVPGIVLVHGGGGTAFANWVRLWNSRGYAAIAMDTYGTVPKGNPYVESPARHDKAGPIDAFQPDEAIEDQWTYHAIADVLLSAALLRGRPEVDAGRIGITGISWGGYLTCIAAGIDPRFQFAAPVYGCGFLGDDSAWLPYFKRLGPEKAAKWLGLWDPSRYLGRARQPFLWVDDTNDVAYPLSSLQKSYQLLPPAQRTLCVEVRRGHAHGAVSENPPEIHAFADAIFKGGTPLAQIIEQKRDGNKVSVRFQSPMPIVRAELNYTQDSGPWIERKWETIPALLNGEMRQAQANLPPDATVYYMNLIDQRGLVVSSEHVEMRHN